MAFNTLEYLRDGKVDFVYHQTSYDSKHLQKTVREASNRIEIINGFLPKLKEDLPYWCFDIIYDIPEFSKEALELLDIKVITPEKLERILNNSTYGNELLSNYLDYFLKHIDYDRYLSVICEYALSKDNQEIIARLSRHSNLHVRFLFMTYLIEHYPNKIDTIYDDITKYTTSVTYELYEQLSFLPELMSPEDISKLAVSLLRANRKNDYQKLKEYILEEYKYNYLASQLLRHSHDGRDRFGKEFNHNADILFKTSQDYQLSIYLCYRERVSEELMKAFAERIKYFEREGAGYELMTVYSNGLGRKLEEFVDKYLAMSKRKDYEFLGSGTTCACFRVGDYAFKLVKTKWSYEDVICPNLYLIAKNYEEIYLRDNRGVVCAGLEVQKYLSRKADELDPKYFRYFDLALDRLGYKRTDSLTKGVCGENTMLLDSYRDADCKDPERVPVWFKQYPLVLVDRDRIYRKDEPYIKQLRSGY